MQNVSRKGNSTLVTQDSFIALKNFVILISIDISIKINQFLYASTRPRSNLRLSDL